MNELDGFHLRLICAAGDDRPLTEAGEYAELRALLEPLSANDSDASGVRWNKFNAEERPSTAIFIPLKQAINPSLWDGVVNWIQGKPGRALRLRFKQVKGYVQAAEEIPPLLEKTLKALRAIVQQSKPQE